MIGAGEGCFAKIPGLIAGGGFATAAEGVGCLRSSLSRESWSKISASVVLARDAEGDGADGAEDVAAAEFD